MKLITRFTSAVLALAMGASIFCSCQGKKDVVMTLGDFDVTFEHYRYLYMNIYNELKATDSSLTDEKLDTEAKETAMKSLRHTAAVYALADRYSAKLSDEDESAIDDYISSTIESYDSPEDFEAELTSSYMSEAFFRRALEMQQLETVLRAKMTDEYTGDLNADDATVISDIKANFYRAKQVLIKNDEGDDEAANLERAEEVLSRALAGEDFETLISEYGEDTVNGDYCFTKGQLLAEFEDAVKGLSENEICNKVVSSEAGYHIIKRTAITDDYIKENLDSLREAFLARRFNEAVDECSASLAETDTKLFPKITKESLASGVLSGK